MSLRDWLMIGIGAGGGLLAFFFVFGFVINDKPARNALTWLALRKNIAHVYMFLALAAAVGILVMLGSAYAKAFMSIHIQVAPWVQYAVYGIIGIGALSLIVNYIERKKTP